jgi:hypothetical protein
MTPLYKRIAKAVFTVAFLISTSFSAFANDGYLLIDTGYRYDRIDEMNTTFLAPVATSSAFTSYQSIGSYQLGLKGLYYTDCLPVLFKGCGHYGWLFTGSLLSGPLKGDLGGHTADGNIGLGYIFSICDCFDLVPLIGGSYDIQSLQSKSPRARFFNPAIIRAADGVRFTSAWFGPWAGFDLYFQNDCACCPITFNAGYEFHYGWAHTHIKPRVPNSPLTGTYNYTAYLNNVTGHVFHIQGLRSIFDCFLVGLNLQYTFWSNHHSVRNRIPSLRETGLPPTTTAQKTTLLNWHSFAATFDVGFCF